MSPAWRRGAVLFLALQLATSTGALRAAEEKAKIEPSATWSLQLEDSLGLLKDEKPDAQEALDGLKWKPGKFKASSTPLSREKDEADAVIRYPSPLPCGIAQCDVATLHWYAAFDDNGKPISAPAVVVIHESGSRQTIGRLFARAFRDKGIHAFMLSLPNYALRRSPDVPGSAESLLTRMKQGIADARRAHDIVAAIPCVDAEHIGLQGISLGGFVAATTAGIDPAYHSVFIMLAGGDLSGIVLNGGDVAERVRQRLTEMGLTEEEIKKLAWPVEPLRLAHRLNPDRTWVYTAKYDQIIPVENASRLVEAGGLAKNHHVMLAADHYTGVIYYTMLLNQMIEQLKK
jgi:dienelactone hydrolase